MDTRMMRDLSWKYKIRIGHRTDNTESKLVAWHYLGDKSLCKRDGHQVRKDSC